MRKNISSQTGATMVEAAMVLGLLVILSLGIIELGRYFHLRSIMTRSANKGLELAIRHSDLLIDSRTVDVEDGDDDRATRLMAAIAEVQARALTLPLPEDQMADSVTEVATIPSAPGDPEFAAIPGAKVLVVRPGDRGVYTQGTHSSVVVTHPTYPELQNDDDFIAVMQDNPILVEINASMPSIVPFIGNIPIRVQALGLPEIITRGIEGVPSEQQPINPFCGDNIFTNDPNIEQCDFVLQGEGDSQTRVAKGVKPGTYCVEPGQPDQCTLKSYCGNGIAEREQGEACDKWSVPEGDPPLVEGIRECSDKCTIKPIEPCGNGYWEQEDPYNEECDASVTESIADRDPKEWACIGCKWHDITPCLVNGNTRVSRECIDNSIPAGFVCVSCVLCDCEGEEECSKCAPGVCGNGIKETGEACDRHDGAGYSEFCDDCALVKPLCGNGVADFVPARFEGQDDYSEDCDGEDVAPDKQIASHQTCSANCTIATLCHNNRIDSNPPQFEGDVEYSEECDGELAAEGYEETLALDSHECIDCKIESKCGNGRLDNVGTYTEECDPSIAYNANRPGNGSAPDRGVCVDCKRACLNENGQYGTYVASGNYCVYADTE